MEASQLQSNSVACAVSRTERDQAAGRPHYGAVGSESTSGRIISATGGHGRARPARGVRTRRFGEEPHARLSGVPEGDETDDGGVRQPDTAMHSAVPPRIFFTVLAWAVMSPLLILGPQLGKDVLALPKSIPAHQWQWTGSNLAPPSPHILKGAHLAQVSQRGIAKLSAATAGATADASGIGSTARDAVLRGGSDDLLRTLSTIQNSNDAMMGGASGPDRVRIQQTHDGVEIVKVGRRSIWNYGPFVFTLGVMVSILAKLLIAQPLAKAGTDLLLMWAGTQAPAQDSEEYYGYVYLERDEEFGGPSPRSTSSQRNSTSSFPATAIASSSTVASQAVTPRLSVGEPHSRPHSTESKRSSSGRKKWGVTLDLPDTGVASFGASHPQPLPRARNLTAETPLPILSPESALTSPGDTLMSDLGEDAPRT